MKSKIQLQDIKDVGLLVYYDKPDYYELPLKTCYLDVTPTFGIKYNENA